MPIELIDKIKPKNNGSFPLVDAEDVDLGDGIRLSTVTDAPKLTPSARDYAFDVTEAVKIVSVEVSSSVLGSTIVYLEQKQDETYITKDQKTTTGGIVTFNLSDLKTAGTRFYRFRAVNAFSRESCVEITVDAVSVEFNITQFPEGLLTYTKGSSLALNFTFDSIPTIEQVKEINFIVESVVDGTQHITSTTVVPSDSTIECQVELENFQKNSYSQLTYYLQYTLTNDKLIRSATSQSTIYALEESSANFNITLPQSLTSSEHWEIKCVPIFDIAKYPNGCKLKLQFEETELESIERTFTVDQLFTSQSISVSPVNNEEPCEITVIANVFPIDSELSIQEHTQTIAVSLRNLWLSLHYDADSADISKDTWYNKVNNNFNLDLINSLTSPLTGDEAVFTGNSYAHGYVPDFSPLDDMYNGFTLETYVRSDFLGNLTASAVNIGDIIDINYDKVKFSFAGTSCQTEVLADTYHHIAVVCDLTTQTREGNINTLDQLQVFNNRANLKIYIDGVLCAATHISNPQDNIQPFNRQELFISSYKGDSSKGKNKTHVKYVKFYQTPLTSADVYNKYIQAIPDAESVMARNDLKNILELWFERDVKTTPSDGFEGPTTFEELHKITKKKRNSTDQFRASQTSWVNCNVWYKLPGQETLTQAEYKARILLQGTSTLAYPVKNYRFNPYRDIITNSDITSAENYNNASIVPPGAPDGWQEDKQFTLKCDFMESSHRNNTPTACYYHDKLLPAVIDAVHNTDESNRSEYYSPARKAGFRDSINGYPCVVYYIDNHSDNISPDNIRQHSIFAGSYMFNVDKEGTELGFTVPNCDHMVSYEGGTNTNIGAAAFKTAESYNRIMSASLSEEDYIEESIEARFASMGDDDKTYLNKFKALIEFLNSPDNPALHSVTSEQEANYKTAFKSTFDYAYCMAYYIQMLLFAQVDSAGKNAMFDYWHETGKVYLRPYDMDTQVGLSNFGRDEIPVTAVYHETLIPDTSIYRGDATLVISPESGTLTYTLNNVTTTYNKSDGYTYESGKNKIIFNKEITDDTSYYVVIREGSFEHAYFDVPCKSIDNNYVLTLSVLNAKIGSRLSWSTNQSLLWRTFHKLFAEDIINVYTKLRQQLVNVSDIDEYIRDKSTDQIGETIYNADAAKRYLSYMSESNTYDPLYYGNIQGTRNIRYYKYLRDRIKFLDSYFNITGITTDTHNFRNGNTHLVSNTLSTSFNIIPKLYSPSYIRVSVDQGASTVQCLEDTSSQVVITTNGAQKKNMDITGLGNAYEVVNIKDADPSELPLGGIPDLITLDLSGCSKLGQCDILNKPYLSEVTLNDIESNSLAIKISGTPNLHKIIATDSKFASLELPETLESVEELNLDGTVVQKFSISNNNKLTLDSTLTLKKDTLSELKITDCSNIASNGKITFNKSDYLNLKTLRFCNNSVEELNICNFTDNFVLDFGDKEAKDTTLKTLRIDTCQFTEDTILDLTKFTDLNYLSLTNISSTCSVKLPISVKQLCMYNVNFSSVETSESGVNVADGTYDFTGVELTNNTSSDSFVLEDRGGTIIRSTPVKKIANLKINYPSDTRKSLSYAFRDNELLETFVNTEINGNFSQVLAMFRGCKSLTDIPTMNNDIHWENCGQCSECFYNCQKMQPKYSLELLQKITSARGDNGVSCNVYMYNNKESKFTLSLGSLPKNILSAEGMFHSSTIEKITVPENFGDNKICAKNLSEMFSRCKDLTIIPRNFLDYFSFQPSSDISFMFYACSTLCINDSDDCITTNNSTLSNVTQADGLFRGCSALNSWKNVNLIRNLSNVENFNSMYSGCSSLNPELQKDMFNSANIVSLENIFAKTALELPAGENLPLIFGENCTNLKYASGMFAFTTLRGEIPDDLFVNAPNVESLGITWSSYEFLYSNDRTIVPGIFMGTELGSLTVDLKKLLSPLTNLKNISGMFANVSRDTTNLDTSLSTDKTYKLTFTNPETQREIRLKYSTGDSLSTTVTDESFLFANTKVMLNSDDSLISYIAPNVENLTGAFMNSNVASVNNLTFNNFTSLKYIDYVFAGCADTSFTYLQDDNNEPTPLFSSSIIRADYAFSDCKNFKDIYINAFDGATALTSAIGCFQNTGIQQLPEGKATLCIDWNKINSDESQESSLYVVAPGGLFKDCENLEHLDACFANCAELHGNIPYSLLRRTDGKKFNKLTTISSLFRGSFNLSVIPKNETSLDTLSCSLSDIFEIELINTNDTSVTARFNNRPIVRNVRNVAQLVWNVTKTTTEDLNEVILTPEELDNNYFIPEDWFVDCSADITDLSYVFAEVGAGIEDHQNKDWVTENEDTLLAAKLPNLVVLPIEANIQTTDYCFAKVPILKGTSLNNDFMNGAMNLSSTKGMFYRACIGCIDLGNPCFKKPKYITSTLKNVSYMFYVKQYLSPNKLSEESHLPDFSKTTPNYFAKPDVRTSTYNSVIVDSALMSYLDKAYSQQNGSIAAVENSLPLKVTHTATKTMAFSEEPMNV